MCLQSRQEEPFLKQTRVAERAVSAAAAAAAVGGPLAVDGAPVASAYDDPSAFNIVTKNDVERLVASLGPASVVLLDVRNSLEYRLRYKPRSAGPPSTWARALSGHLNSLSQFSCRALGAMLATRMVVSSRLH